MKFLKKVGYSITKIEKYAEMATEGLGKAIAYLAILVLIMTIVICGCTFVKINEQVQDVASYIETELPEFSYKDNALTMEGEQPLKIENPETSFNKIIIDTKTENDEETNKYKEEIKSSESGLLISKNNLTIIEGTQEVTYTYSDLTNMLQKKEFNKSELIGFLRGSEMLKVYAGMSTILIVYTFIAYFISVIWTTVIIALIGHIASIFLKVKMRYRAVFNMAAYAMTLSIILELIYIIVNMFTDFTIKYFDVLYTAVAFIYLIAAIFLTRIDLMKQQEELMKVKEVQKEVREQMKEDEEKKQEEEKKQPDDKKEKEKKKKDKEKKDNGGQEGEPEGSNV